MINNHKNLEENKDKKDWMMKNLKTDNPWREISHLMVDYVSKREIQERRIQKAVNPRISWEKNIISWELIHRYAFSGLGFPLLRWVSSCPSPWNLEERMMKTQPQFNHYFLTQTLGLLKVESDSQA